VRIDLQHTFWEQKKIELKNGNLLNKKKVTSQRLGTKKPWLLKFTFAKNLRQFVMPKKNAGL
jgi:hypothetical protein